MAITTNGTLASTTGTAITSLNLAATSAIGDIRVFYSKVNSSSITASSISGGNATTWTRVAGPSTDTSAVIGTHDLWIGPATSAGATAVTVTWSGSVTGLGIDFDCQTFSFGNSATTWARDGAALTFQNNASSTTITYPSGTATNAGELYVGHSRNASGGSYGTPTGGGFTWVSQTDANGNTFIYSLSVGSGTVAPTQTTTATLSYAIGVLLIASLPGSASNIPRRIQPAGIRQSVNRAMTY